MAFDNKPNTWIPGWSVTGGTDIAVAALATAFPQMTAAEAHATTGDIRKVLFAICDKIWSVWNALASGDKPTMMKVNRSSFVNETTGLTTRTYTFQFVTATTGEEVENEPAP